MAYDNPADSDKIRAAFRRSGLTQREVAQQMGLTDQAIHAYVTGFRKPAAGNLFKLAKVLGVDVRELMRDDAA